MNSELERTREKSGHDREGENVRKHKMTINRWPCVCIRSSSRIVPPVTQSRTAHTFFRSRAYSSVVIMADFAVFAGVLPVRCIFNSGTFDDNKVYVQHRIKHVFVFLSRDIEQEESGSRAL